MSETCKSMFDDARQLFEAFTHTSWRQFDLAHGQMRLSISRARNAEHAIFRDDLESNISLHVGEDHKIFRAPHTATLISLVPLGTMLRPGDRYGLIRILDETVELISIEAAEVVAHLVRPSEFLEYQSPLIKVV